MARVNPITKKELQTSKQIQNPKLQTKRRKKWSVLKLGFRSFFGCLEV